MLRSALRATRLGALAPTRALSTLAPALRPLAPRASPLLRNCAPPRLAPSPLRTLCSSAEGFAPPPPPLPRSGLGGPVQRGGMAGAASEQMRRMPRNPGQAGVISIRSTWNNTIVNVADDEPTPSAELLEFAAELLGCNLPAEESYADASQTMSAMAQSFWSENRRVSNRLLCKELGYTLLHPNYRSGLQDCLKQEHH